MAERQRDCLVVVARQAVGRGDQQVLLFAGFGRDDTAQGRRSRGVRTGEGVGIVPAGRIGEEAQAAGAAGPVVGSFSRPLGSAFRAVDGDFVHIDFSVATAVTLNWSRLATVTEVPRVMPSTSERKEMALRFVSSVSSFEQDASAATLKVMNKSFAFISYTLNG